MNHMKTTQVNVHKHRFWEEPELQITGFPNPTFPNPLEITNQDLYTLFKDFIVCWHGFALLFVFKHFSKSWTRQQLQKVQKMPNK